ncbi:hypothetical protein PRZ48_015183 [Zasmidium cellare]|uniref:RRM domain-containing protein n=1 Tax=Zasmidium cellare TaxID=395010 RepID=A0ABR0DXW0_ZASCE|nr:hypothetical protein PRZ48_015183 [Zasmidium cellare]
MAATTRSLDDMLRESREKRKAQDLAEEIFGRRNKTPATRGAKPAQAASLASRVGINKRTSSLPRSNTAPPRNARNPPSFNRPSNDNHRASRPSAFSQPSSDPVSDARSNGYGGYDAPAANGGGPGVSIRGAAAGPHVVIASNFAPGTTAADIESVMLDVGGQMTECRLVATTPTVMAEMTFVEKSGAETVINTFNNKKADGRTLHVYWKASGTGPRGQQPVAQADVMDDSMEVDQNAESREAENRLREERRGRSDREPRDAFPTGPKNDRQYEDDYYRGPRRAEPAYQDGRYGFDGGRYGRGSYRDGGRMYSDRMGRGGGGQSWRP